MIIEIRNKFNTEVIHSGNFNTTKELLEDGVKKGISFKGANLRGAYFEGAYSGGVYLANIELLKTL